MEKQGIEPQPSGDQVASLDLIAILNRRKAWLFLSCLIGLGIGAAYFFLSPKRYESRAELLLMQNDSEPMSSSGGAERDVSEELLATHMKLVQSSRIVKNALAVDVEVAKEMAKIKEATHTDEETGAETKPKDADTATDSQILPDSAAPPATVPSEEPLTPSDVSVQAEATSAGATQSEATPQNTPSAVKPEEVKPIATPADNPVAVKETAATGDAAQPAKSPGELIEGLSPAEAITGIKSLVVDNSGSVSIDPSETTDLEAGINQLKLLKSINDELSSDMSPSEYVIKNMFVTNGGSGRARNARVLNIAIRHTDPRDCELLVRAVVDRYQDFVRNKFKDINSEAATLIIDKYDDFEAEIKSSEKEYREFRMESPLLSKGAAGTDIFTTRYEELAAEISQLAISRDEAAGRLEMVKTSLAEFEKDGAHNLQKLALIDERNAERLGILVTVERGKAETAAFQSTQPERMAGATAEYSSLLTMKTRLSQLTADFGPEYPEVKALRQQIGEMEGFLSKKQKELFIGEDTPLTPDDVMRAYVSMLDHDLRALDQRSKDIEKQMEVAVLKAKELVDYQLQDEQKVRELDRKQELANAVAERVRDLNMKKDASPLILELIQEPTPAEKVEPKGIIAAAISMLCALLVGGAGVLVAELRDRSVHSPEEFEEMLGSRVLAHLPNFQNDAEVRKLQRVARKMKSPLSPSLLTYYAPDSRASETFRALRTQVMFSAGGDHKIVATTSSNQGAGKSMISSNMAISMAGLGAEVLLIDCDMRLPQVHRLFGVPNEKGLADAIVNPKSVDDYLVPSTVPGLTLLPSGQAPENPAELLSRPECKELLESLRSRFAYIILDCPPVLAVSDPSIIAPLADGVLFVSVVDNESRPKTLRAKRILEGVGAEIIGIIVNRSDESSQRYGYQAYGYESVGQTDSYYNTRPTR